MGFTFKGMNPGIGSGYRDAQAMDEGAGTAVRTEGGQQDQFDVRIGLHQGSSLSPLLFIILMGVVSPEMT